MIKIELIQIFYFLQKALEITKFHGMMIIEILSSKKELMSAASRKNNNNIKFPS